MPQNPTSRFTFVSDDDSSEDKLMLSDINSKYSDGKTLLLLAIKHKNSYNIIKQLLEAGADPNIIDNEGNNAIFYAAHNLLVNSEAPSDEDIKLIRLLIHYKSDPFFQNKEGDSALSISITEDEGPKYEALTSALLKFNTMTTEPAEDEALLISFDEDPATTHEALSIATLTELIMAQDLSGATE